MNSHIQGKTFFLLPGTLENDVMNKSTRAAIVPETLVNSVLQ